MAWPPNQKAEYPPRPSEDEIRRRQWEEDYNRAGYGDRRPADILRPRSRSPAEDDGRKRRRSTSPYDRGRYEPRPRFGDDRDYSRGRDDYGASSRKGGYHGRDGRSGRPPPPNPYELEHSVPLKHYADWFRYAYPEQAAEEDRMDAEAAREAGADAPRPRDGIRSRWEKYKKDFVISQIAIMFEHHRKSPWFAEKYDPAEFHVNLRQRVRKEGWRGRISQFLLELDEGKHDPELALTEGLTNLLTDESSTKDVTENGKAVASDRQDEDATFTMDGEDADPGTENKPVNESKEMADTKHGARDDDVSVSPEGNEVMIRTIPPDIGRVKLEEACSTVSGFVHLALGEPLQKRNFYRAGWIRFDDSTDMEKAIQELGEKKLDGFKLHVAQTVRPFTTRLRMTPEAASRPERIRKDLLSIKRLASELEKEAASLRRFSLTKARKVPAARDEVSKEPNGEATDTKPSLEHAERENGFTDGEGEAEEIEPEPMEKGSDAVDRRIAKLVSDVELHSPGDLDGGIGWEAKKDALALDLYRTYLRVSYNTCYYCAAKADHVEELQRKCVKHVRKALSPKSIQEIAAARKAELEKGDSKTVDDVVMETALDQPPNSATEKSAEDKGKEKLAEGREWKRNDERWLEWLDSKLALLVNREEVDPRDYGGKDYEEELSKACEAHIKQEDEGKFRCKQCNKLFKAISFVEKHVANKHPEVVAHMVDDLTYHNNFALDPLRIQPFAHMPPPSGNSAPLPPQAYGLKTSQWPNPPVEYGRGPAPYPHAPYASVPPAPYIGYMPPPPAFYEPYAYAPYAAPYPHEGTVYPPNAHHRRLSERVGGFTDQSGGFEGLPPKPVMPMSEISGPRAPPPDVKEDPRASGGRKVSYHDIDRAAYGDDPVELSY